MAAAMPAAAQEILTGTDWRITALGGAAGGSLHHRPRRASP
jgi:hypothetical protein